MEEPKDKRTKLYKEWKAQQPTKIKLGLGDVIAKVTKATGIDKLVGDDCGCNERKNKANKIPTPFYKKASRCMDKDQLSWFGEYIERRSLSGWNSEDIKELVKLYAHVFALQYNVGDLCINCAGSGRILRKIDEQLEIVYNEST